MRRDRKELYKAWLLLLVFVPMVVLSSVHVHTLPENVSVNCDQCHEHMHHGGHFTTPTSHLDDCVQCRFLSQQYEKGVTTTYCFHQTLIAVVCECVNRQCPSVELSSNMLRAPPTNQLV